MKYGKEVRCLMRLHSVAQDTHDVALEQPLVECTMPTAPA